MLVGRARGRILEADGREQRAGCGKELRDGNGFGTCHELAVGVEGRTAPESQSTDEGF